MYRLCSESSDATVDWQLFYTSSLAAPVCRRKRRDVLNNSKKVNLFDETGRWKTLFEKEKQAAVPGSRKRRTAIAFLVAAPLTSALQTVKISKRTVERITDTKWIQNTDKNVLAVHPFCVKISNIVDKRRRGKHLREHLKDFLRPVSLSPADTHKVNFAEENTDTAGMGLFGAAVLVTTIWRRPFGAKPLGPSAYLLDCYYVVVSRTVVPVCSDIFQGSNKRFVLSWDYIERMSVFQNINEVLFFSLKSSFHFRA